MCTHARTKVQDVRPEEDSGSGVRHTCGSKPMSWTSHNTCKLASIPRGKCNMSARVTRGANAQATASGRSTRATLNTRVQWRFIHPYDVLRGCRPWTYDTSCSSTNAFKPNLNPIKQQHATITPAPTPPSGLDSSSIICGQNKSEANHTQTRDVHARKNQGARRTC